MIEHYVIALLTILLVASNGYWGMVCAKLVNKIMSQDYHTYVSAEKYRKQPPRQSAPSMNMDEAIDPTAERQSQELNSILGIV